MESNKVDLQCDRFLNLILNLPESLQMINNQRRIVLCQQIEANKRKSRMLMKAKTRIDRSRLEDSKAEIESETEEEEEGEGPSRETSAAAETSLQQVSTVKQKKILLPTLMTMVYNLGQALSQPIKALSYIKQLYA